MNNKSKLLSPIKAYTLEDRKLTTYKLEKVLCKQTSKFGSTFGLNMGQLLTDKCSTRN